MKFKITETSFNVGKPLGSVVSALVVAALLGVVLPVFAQQGYETEPVLAASKILPPELLSGPNFRVQERVTNDGTFGLRQRGNAGGRPEVAVALPNPIFVSEMKVCQG